MSCAEQRHVVKCTPMTPLSTILSEACGKFKPALDPSGCQLVLNKKPVDLTLPFRLANIPSGSRLDVIKGAWGGGCAAWCMDCMVDACMGC